MVGAATTIADAPLLVAGDGLPQTDLRAALS